MCMERVDMGGDGSSHGQHQHNSNIEMAMGHIVNFAMSSFPLDPTESYVGQVTGLAKRWDRNACMSSMAVKKILPVLTLLL